MLRQKHTHTHENTCDAHAVSGGSKTDVGGSAYESSYGTTRRSRYSSSTEERVAANGTVNAVTSATGYFSIVGEEGVGKPVIKKQCKGVNIERKCMEIRNERSHTCVECLSHYVYV